MIDTNNFDPIGGAVEQFESTWSLQSREQTMEVLRQHGLENDREALAELIRVDMDFRFTNGSPTKLDEYLQIFGDELRTSDYLSDVAYEEFRLRSRYGYPFSAARWDAFPAIRNALWFRDEFGSSSIERNLRSAEIDPNDPIVLALEQAGFFPVRLLGEGQASQVFLATQSDLASRYVVLKVIEHEFACEPQNMAMLQHTNIVPIFSFHSLSKTKLVICMPYSGRVTLDDFYKLDGMIKQRAGASLCRVVRKKVEDSVVRDANGNGISNGKSQSHASLLPAADDQAVLLPLEKIQSFKSSELLLWIFQRVSAGLAHSHARGVIHGDLKPANILIRNDGEPALLDFNLSSSDSRPAKFFGGTLPYMSPETFEALLLGKGNSSTQADIYSIGVLMFEFLNGKLPYLAPVSDDPAELKQAITARRELPIEWENDTKVDEGLKNIITKCLHPDPTQRYETAAPLEQDLQRELDHLPLQFADESANNRRRKWVKRHPSIVSTSSVASAIGIAVILPLAIFSWIYVKRSAQAETRAHVDEFREDTAHALSVWMIDPMRYSESTLNELKQPLEKFGLLSMGSKHFVPSALTKQELDEYRELEWRYLAQIGLVTVNQLRRQHDPESPLADDDEKLNSIDRLISKLEQHPLAANSLALKWIRKIRGDLIGEYSTDPEANESELSVNEKYLLAVREMMRGRLADSTRLLGQIEGKVPASLRLTLLGRSYMNTFQYDQAAMTFTQALEHTPDASRLYFARGLSYMLSKNPQAAVLDYDKAIELEPEFFFAYVNRGNVKYLFRNFRAARDDYTKALSLRPDSLMALVKRCRCNRLMPNSAEATEADYKAAMLLESDNPKALVERGLLRWIHKKDKPGSKLDFLAAADLDRQSAEANFELARWHVKAHPEEALRYFKKTVRINPRSELYRTDLAVHYARMQQPVNAVREINTALRGNNLPRTLYQAGCVYALLEGAESEKALLYIAKSIQLGLIIDITNDNDLKSMQELDSFKALEATIKLMRSPIDR